MNSAIDWPRTRAVVTGGSGFLGSHVVQTLEARGCRTITVPRSKDYDLTTLDAVRRLYREARPDLVIHLAARVGGIGLNQKHPGRLFFDNLMMGTQLVEEGRRAGLKKLVATGTICAYPKFAQVPFREEDLWKGYPEETNAPYGLAKKMLLVQSQAYRQEYGFNSVVLFPVNLYGPRDDFALESSHVIPALIRKIDQALCAGSGEVTLWGDGTPTRDFLYVEDAAEAVVRACERYDASDPLNIGSGREISISDLAHLIGSKMGYRGKFVFDPTRPNGQPRRAVDASRAYEALGFRPSTTLEAGLEQTIRWYRDHRRPLLDQSIPQRDPHPLQEDA